MNDPREVLGPVLVAAVEALIAERLAEVHQPEETWPAYLNVPEAARYCGVSEERLRKLIARRALPVIQEAPGHRVTLARADLDTAMQAWRVEARP